MNRSAAWNIVIAVAIIVAGFIFGTFLWSRADPVQYNEWASRWGLWSVSVNPTPTVPTPTPATLTATQIPINPTEIPASTATPAPTDTITIVCTPDNTGYWVDREEYDLIESASQVTWMGGGRNYSIFLVEGVQMCVEGSVVTYWWEIDDKGLSSYLSSNPASNIGFTGKARIERQWNNVVSWIVLEQPKVVGPNDDLVESAFPLWVERGGDQFVGGLDWVNWDPSYKCSVMGHWAQDVPPPAEVAFCNK